MGQKFRDFRSLEIRKRDLSFRVFKYYFLTELFIWQNKISVLLNKEDNCAPKGNYLAAILFCISPEGAGEFVIRY